MRFNEPRQPEESDFAKYALEKATDEDSVIYTSAIYKRSLFIVHADSIVRIRKYNIEDLFKYLRPGDKFALKPEDVAAFSAPANESKKEIYIIKGNLEIKLILKDGIYKAKVESTTKKSKLKIAVYVIGSTILVSAVIGGAIFLIGPGAIAAVAVAKGAMIFSLAKGHPFMCMGVVSSIAMLAYKYYQYKNNPSVDQQSPQQPTVGSGPVRTATPSE